ncbi:hypothetical protein CEP51_013575 [Fusarium floridanum]|uniref:Transcription factor domain-containing protein n=1 Tax=Fusarium floridanum TaxID=1325733 RepID=A0A428Q956_9HYPO|nr:hypothetical protein CEP51_013575 [Fusarium floridanum]
MAGSVQDRPSTDTDPTASSARAQAPSNPIGVSQGMSTSTEWPRHQDTQQEESPLALGSNEEQQHNLHIVGPAVTSDNQVLSDYLSAMPSATRGSRMIIPVPGNRSRPVLFTMVQKQPLGLDSNRSLPVEKLQIAEKVLEPFMTDLLDVTSLSHGTPPHISKMQYDVPSPTIENLCEKGSSAEKVLKASIYVALVGLTDVLDLHLTHIYQLRKTDELGDVTHLELALNNWIDSMNDRIRRVIIRGTNLDIPGAPNLRLAYLTVRLLLQRIELEAEKRISNAGDGRLLNCYMEARRTSEEMLILTQELQPEHLADFWLPSSAFSFPAAVSFLLRCALETENSPSGLSQSNSLNIASDLLAALRSHKEKHSWDLGDICLAQHTEVVDKLLAMVPEDPGQDGNSDFSEFSMLDPSFIDQFLPSLWDPLQNAW